MNIATFWSIVVSGGCVNGASGMLSTPITARSAGTARPTSRAPASSANAVSSLYAQTPVTRGSASRHLRTAAAAAATSSGTSCTIGRSRPRSTQAVRAPSSRRS
nr:hypothetical protein [Phytohabitans rumicis]